MNRYMVLEGLSGVLVTDPHTDLPDRYVGQVRKPLEERKKLKPSERFNTCRVAAAYHPHLVKAVRRGTIKQIGDYVYAESGEEALAKSLPKQSRSKPKAQTPIKESKEKGNK